MIAYLYAITELSLAPSPDARGLGNARLDMVACKDIAAIVSDHDAMPTLSDVDDVCRHERVIESLMERGTVLPVRFGTLLSSHREVADLLRRRYAVFRGDLDRLRGCVEIGIRCLSCAEEAAPRPRSRPLDATPGTAFLQLKVARQREAETRRAWLIDRVRGVVNDLEPLTVASRLAVPAHAAGESVSVAFLVPRGGVDGFRDAVGAIAERLRELTLFCTGPWPPYSFVRATAEPSTHEGGQNAFRH